MRLLEEIRVCPDCNCGFVPVSRKSAVIGRPAGAGRNAAHGPPYGFARPQPQIDRARIERDDILVAALVLRISSASVGSLPLRIAA
jgi:hypothetical protein